MTISNNYAPDVSAGNGVTDTFSGSWNVIAAAYMVVQVQNVSTGAFTPYVLGTDYTLAFTASGYTITCSTIPATGYNIIRSRNVDIGQAIPFKTSTGFQGLVEENAFDKLTAIGQDLQQQLNNALQFPVGTQGITDAVLPVPLDGYFPVWSGTSGLMVNSGFSAADINTAFTAAVASATAAAAASASAASSSASAASSSQASSSSSASAASSSASAASSSATAAAASAVAAAASAASIALPIVATSGGTSQTTYTEGDILYASATNTLSKLGIGSTGNILTIAAGVPSWGAASGGELILLGSATASSSSTLDFISMLSSSYSGYLLILDNLLNSTSGVFLIRTSHDNSTFDATSGHYSSTIVAQSAGAPGALSNVAGTITTGISLIPSTTTTLSGTIFFNGAENPISSQFSWNLSISGGSVTNYQGSGANINDNTSVLNAIRLLPSAGNFTSGKVYLYGVKNT